LTQYPREALDRYPGQFSGGQRQRIGLMRALMLDPDVILLDEPMGALDPLIRFDLQGDLRRIFETLRKTVVLVTHDMTEAAFFADEIVLLGEGRGRRDEHRAGVAPAITKRVGHGWFPCDSRYGIGGPASPRDLSPPAGHAFFERRAGGVFVRLGQIATAGLRLRPAVAGRAFLRSGPAAAGRIRTTGLCSPRQRSPRSRWSTVAWCVLA